MPRALRVLLFSACVGFAAVAVGSWLLVAAAHAGDSYGVDHVSGTWLALAGAAGEGTLYPPLYDGESFGGTRYMPVPILLHGGLGWLIDDYLVAGKLIAYVLTAVLLVLVVAVLRRERCPWPIASMFAATLLVTNTGLTAAIGIRHDTLPVILQLAAVAVVTASTGRNALLGAGLLCALAVTAKLSAIWAPLAIGLWLVFRKRARLPVFAAAFLAPTLGLLAFFEAVTNGRLTENVIGLGLSGSRGFESFDWEQNRIRLIFGDGLGIVRLLVLLAVIVVVAMAWRGRGTLYHLSLAVSLPILAVVLADRGTNSNQLLDLQVLSVVVLGSTWRGLQPLARGGLAVTVLACGLVGFAQHVEPVDAARALVDRDTSRVPEIARRLGPDEHLLSENPYVPVSLGQKAVVLDAFMLWNIAEDHPEWRDDLVRRLDAREFDAVVLFYRPEDRSRSDAVQFWFETEHFGPENVDAMERNYRAASQVGTLWIYRPRPDAER